MHKMVFYTDTYWNWLSCDCLLVYNSDVWFEQILVAVKISELRQLNQSTLLGSVASTDEHTPDNQPP